MAENERAFTFERAWESFRGGLFRPVVLGVLYVILFLPQIVRLVAVTWQEAKYSHGFIIPFVSVWLLYDSRERLAAVPRRPSSSAALLVGLGILAWLWAQLPAQTFNALAHLSMLVVLAGLVAFGAGWRFLKAVAFPVAYLAFAFPAPKRLDDLYVVLPLQRLASVISADALSILGIHVYRSGNIIEIPGMKLLVEDACSGIHSLYALVAMGTALAFGFFRLLPERRTWEKVALIASTVPIAILANVFRVTLTGILAHLFSPSLAQGFFHYFSGLMVFLLGLGLFFLLAATIRLWFPVPVEEAPPVISRRPIRVGLISELPTPYRWPVFRRLLDRPEIDLRVLFCARTERDRNWTFDFRPDDRVRFLPAATLSFGARRTVHYHVNPTIFGELTRGAFDVVVIPGWFMFASQTTALWCGRNRTPYVVFSETTGPGGRHGPLRALKSLMVKRIVGGAAAWMPTGARARAHLLRFGARDEDMFPFPNTPDVEAFRTAAEESRAGRRSLREKLGAGEGPVALFVARLLGVKRCDLLLDALAELDGRGGAPALWVAGDGAERPALEARARRLGLDRVRFLGNLPSADLPALYAAADVFVLPSEHEPWGAVVCEAMACSLPVVLSDRVGSAPDLVEEGGNGAVFASGDAGALADVLGRILAEPDALRRMGHRSGQIISRFTHEECVGSFLGAVERAFRRGKEGCPTVVS